MPPDTRRRILDTARELFNEQGVHRVGVRDLARATGMSPGNLAYHFATKDDLIAALVTELHELNTRQVFAELPRGFSLVTLYLAARAVMQSCLVYRFVLLSYVDAVRASPRLLELETAQEAGRRRRANQMMALLAHNGFVDRRRTAARADVIYEQSRFISSGWLAAAALYPDGRDDDESVLHYAKLGCLLLEPYCTLKGARQMRQILRGAHDAALRLG